MLSLSVNQERVLISRELMRQTSREPPPSIIRFGLQLEGTLDISKLNDALSQILSRHAGLRIRYIKNPLVPTKDRQNSLAFLKRSGIFFSGLYKQSVAPYAHFGIIELDFTNQTETEQTCEIRNLVSAQDHTAFSDDEPVRMRAFVVKTAPGRAILMLWFDHTVFDGFSVITFRRELDFFLCGRKDCKKHSRLAEPVLSFPSFAEWQNASLVTSYFLKSASYWRDQWARFAAARIAFEDVPFVLPSTKRFDYSFKTEHCFFSGAETIQLRLFARSTKVSLFAVFLTAFAAILGKYTGKTAVGIWGHFLNRVQLGTMDAVGFFSNTHLLGIEPDLTQPALDVVRYVARVVSRSLVHQELPLPYLWNTLMCAPRFQDAVVLMDFRSDPPEPRQQCSGSVATQPAPLPDMRTSRFANLGIYVRDRGGVISLSANYLQSGFSQDGIQTLVKHLRGTVLALASEPEASLGAILSRIVQGGNAAPDAPGPMGEFVVFNGNDIPRLDVAKRGD